MKKPSVAAPPKTWENYALISFVCFVVVSTGWHPQTDRTTWFLENLPIFIIFPIVLRKQPSFQLSRLALYVTAFHSLVLAVGGHYSYAQVPIGFAFQNIFHLSRNHFDRLGHLMQGLSPAIVLWELLLKKSRIQNCWFRGLVVISMALAFSAFYELIEWWSACILGQGAEAFLGTQGDTWDTQWDLFMALVGAILGTLLSLKILGNRSSL